MNRIYTTILLTIFFLAFTRSTVTLDKRLVAAVTLEDVGFITQLKGKVSLQRNGRVKQVIETTKLQVGDVVAAQNDGEAAIYQVYACVFRLIPNTKKKIDQLAPPPPSCGLTLEQFGDFRRIYFSSSTNRRVKSPRTMGNPNDERLTLLSPRFSVALEARPEFVWTKINRASDYIVKVYNQRDEVLWSAVSSADRISYAGEKPLNDGNYKWDVTARVGNRIVPEQSLFDAVPFSIMVEGGKAIRENLSHALRIASNTDATNLAYIGALFKYKLYPQAEVELQKARTRSPEDETLRTLLMENYRLTERWRDRERLREQK